MTCPALLLHVEVDVGGMSFYLLLPCPYEKEFELPNMLKSALSYCRDYLAVPTAAQGVLSARINKEEKKISLICREGASSCKGVLKVWCKMSHTLYPFLTDVEIAKNVKNYLVFNDVRAFDVKEGGGFLSLQENINLKSMNLRNLFIEQIGKGRKSVPLLAPQGTFFVVTLDRKIMYVSKNSKMEVMKVEEGLRDATPFFFGYAFVLLTKNKLTVLKKSGDKWESVDEMPNVDGYRVEWGSLEGEPAIILYSKNKVIIKSMKGDMAVLNTEGATSVAVSVNTETVILGYPEEVRVLNLYTGEEEAKFKTPGVKRIAWTLYSDFAAMCSDTMCWIFSNLSKSLVTARKVSDVSGIAWGSNTYNLFLSRGKKMSAIFFNPHGVRTWRLIVRRPIPRGI